MSNLYKRRTHDVHVRCAQVHIKRPQLAGFDLSPAVNDTCAFGLCLGQRTLLLLTRHGDSDSNDTTGEFSSLCTYNTISVTCTSTGNDQPL